MADLFQYAPAELVVYGHAIKKACPTFAEQANYPVLTVSRALGRYDGATETRIVVTRQRTDSVLTDRRTTGLASSHNLAMTIDQFLEQLQILIVDIHRSRSFAIDENRVLLLGSNLVLGPFASAWTSSLHPTIWSHIGSASKLSG